MTDTVAVALTAAIGKRLKRLREQAGVRQESVAVAARACGLKWGRSTIAMLEAGRRRLDPEELLLLPVVLRVAQVADVTLLDLLADDDGGQVELTPGAKGPREEIAKLLDPAQGPASLDLRQWDMPGVATQTEVLEAYVASWDRLEQPMQWRGGLTAEQLATLESDGSGEAEQVAARKLGVAPADVALAARRAWGLSLTTMRDRRAAKVVTADELGSESLRALRGHATRELLEELRPYLKGED
jgi:transcriptional regulator with XRE-family HTH domain